jgi:hypothetical protein
MFQLLFFVNHVFLTLELADTEIAKLSSGNILSKIKRLKEFNIEFIAHESQAFHLDMSNAMVEFFSQGASTYQRHCGCQAFDPYDCAK